MIVNERRCDFCNKKIEAGITSVLFFRVKIRTHIRCWDGVELKRRRWDICEDCMDKVKEYVQSKSKSE